MDGEEPIVGGETCRVEEGRWTTRGGRRDGKWWMEMRQLGWKEIGRRAE